MVWYLSVACAQVTYIEFEELIMQVHV